ncbi:hypothetical protein AB733_17220 [Photobacterium swingsii]|uniref:IucA/IucC family siderophore biosynthesis protein n=1 Tax=Photobacterium swingsii TaxID=680026 RepID=A0A0J8V7M1_9GAMM|nr:IucA/IucC family protein [Photobacterium swingsii]KMV29458.1 hypothetical protein AB733_17220 [Photobacterium swingsii]PSW20894.1 IucA/IucC family siderophore biosynthesis protein [Photobacterium swingsii]
MPLPKMACLSPELRVLRQLIEALLFEACVSVTREEVAAQTCCFRWQMREHYYSVEGREGAFGRIRIDIASLKFRLNPQASDFNKPTLTDVMQDLPTSFRVKTAMDDEFQQTIALCLWNTQYLPMVLSRRCCDYSQLETSLDEGHPYHPSFKARTGFSLDDHQSYGPEAGQTFSLRWLAVKQSYLNVQLPLDPVSFWLQELGERHWHQLTQLLAQHQGDWQSYGLVPIHPWQWQQLQQAWLLDAQRNKSVIDLGELGDAYRATQSVRTLMNVSDPLKAHIKLPMNMVNTSSRRTLEPHSICSAPAISEWIANIVASDPELTHLVALKEYAGIHFQPPECALNQAPADGQLGVIFRESVQSQLAPNQQAIPFNALMMIERDGLPFISDWVEKYGLATWLIRLFEVAITPVWHMLVKHGVALEAHGQNMVLVHQDGWPERLMVRDFHESVEYHADFLADPTQLPDFPELSPLYQDAPPDLYYEMSSVELLRELVMDTLFVFNLTEVSYLIETHYHFEESAFWALVNQCLKRYAIQHPELATRLACLHYDTTHIMTESLMTRKLAASRDECHHAIPNILTLCDK